jgi:hypothetical protein
MSDSKGTDADVEATDLAEEGANDQNRWLQWPDMRWWWRAVVHNEAEGIGPMNGRGAAGVSLLIYTFVPTLYLGFLFRNITHPWLRPFLAGGFVVFSLLSVGGIVLMWFSLITDVVNHLRLKIGV